MFGWNFWCQTIFFRGTEAIWTWRGWEICKNVIGLHYCSVFGAGLTLPPWVVVHLSLQHHLTFCRNIKEFSVTQRIITPQITTTKTLRLFVIWSSSTSTISLHKKYQKLQLHPWKTWSSKSFSAFLLVASNPGIPPYPPIYAVFSTCFCFNNGLGRDVS